MPKKKKVRRPVKRKRTKSSPPVSGLQHQIGIPIDRDDFAYLVGVLAWHEGLTANHISKRLFKDSSSQSLMKVKRALKLAHNTVLKFKVRDEEELRQELDQAVNEGHHGRRVNFHVVLESERTTGAPVYAKAAELVNGLIHNAISLNQNNQEKRQVVICNAGGRTVAETVKALARNPPARPDCDGESQGSSEDSLVFVAGNAACEPDQFHRSANFLSVTMAQLYEARHFALPQEENKNMVDDHRKSLQSAALFICGAGACHIGEHSGLMTQYFKNRAWEIPAQAVGDIAFNLLDKNGDEVKLSTPESHEFIRKLNPSVDLLALKHIADSGRVLLILDSKHPHTKRQIGTAVLRKRYATDVVLGSRLASEILKEWNLPALPT